MKNILIICNLHKEKKIKKILNTNRINLNIDLDFLLLYNFIHYPIHQHIFGTKLVSLFLVAFNRFIFGECVWYLFSPGELDESGIVFNRSASLDMEKYCICVCKYLSFIHSFICYFILLLLLLFKQLKSSQFHRWNGERFQNVVLLPHISGSLSDIN